MLVEELLDATYGHNADKRQRVVFREALLGLVRLAKAEQVREMRTCVDKLIGNSPSITVQQPTKSTQRNHVRSGRWPQQMEFNQFD